MRLPEAARSRQPAFSSSFQGMGLVPAGTEGTGFSQMTKKGKGKTKDKDKKEERRGMYGLKKRDDKNMDNPTKGIDFQYKK